MAVFQRATLIGVGLIGGSLGMALRARGLAREVVGVTRTEEAVTRARQRGAIDRGGVDRTAVGAVAGGRSGRSAQAPAVSGGDSATLADVCVPELAGRGADRHDRA